MKPLATSIAALVLGGVAGVLVGPATAGPDSTAAPAVHVSDDAAPEPYRSPRPDEAVAHPPYPVNANGMTYGSGANIDEHDPGPDLILAYGVDGTLGYVRSTDRPQAARTLAEARAAMESADPTGHDIPLYAQDGVTVIGSLHIGPGRALTSRAPEPGSSS